jgi:Cu-Zn family superoxide dismutase
MNGICVIDPNSSSNSGKISGIVTFHSCSNDNTVIHFKLSGFKPNTVHGCHIHSYGDLTQGCASSCSHYEPDKAQLHGSMKLYGTSRHIGDMTNNIVADSQGNVDFIYIDDLVRLTGPYSVIGRMIVIHDKADDLGIYRYEQSERGKQSGITGNAGSRIACAIIGITNTNFHPSSEDIRLAKDNTEQLYQ